MDLKIGKLYVCSEYNLLVFPTEERAASAGPWFSGAGAATWAWAYDSAYWAEWWSEWWSKEWKCHVSVIPAGRVFCVVEEMGGKTRDCHQVHVVAGEALGWINVADWMNIEEMKS